MDYLLYWKKGLDSSTWSKYIYVYIYIYIHTYLPTYIHTYIYIYFIYISYTCIKYMVINSFLSSITGFDIYLQLPFHAETTLIISFSIKVSQRILTLCNIIFFKLCLISTHKNLLLHLFSHFQRTQHPQNPEKTSKEFVSRHHGSKVMAVLGKQWLGRWPSWFFMQIRYKWFFSPCLHIWNYLYAPKLQPCQVKQFYSILQGLVHFGWLTRPTKSTICWITQISKFMWPNMGPIWVLSAPDGPRVGLINLAIWVVMVTSLGWCSLLTLQCIFSVLPISSWVTLRLRCLIHIKPSINVPLEI